MQKESGSNCCSNGCLWKHHRYYLLRRDNPSLNFNQIESKYHVHILRSLHLSAGCILKKMGIPIDLVACVNSNDVVARFLKEGDYSVDSEVPTKCTWATAMDIQVTYV